MRLHVELTLKDRVVDVESVELPTNDVEPRQLSLTDHRALFLVLSQGSSRHAPQRVTM